MKSGAGEHALQYNRLADSVSHHRLVSRLAFLRRFAFIFTDSRRLASDASHHSKQLLHFLRKEVGMTKEVFDSTAMRRTLIRRFAVAMTLVCFTTIISLAAVFAQLKKNERDAHLINISGRQRMLSQRIAFLATSENASVARQFTSTSLENCITAMREAHSELSQDSSYSPMRAQLFTKPMGLNHQVERYLDSATRLMQGTGTEADKEFVRITAINGAFLNMLDQVVRAYEAEYDTKLSRFKLVESILLCVSLLAVGLVSWLVFRPTVGLVASNLRSLERSNSELMEFSYRISHDLRAPVVSALGITEVTKDALEDGDTDSATQGVEHVHRSLTRVSATIEDIVHLVKHRMTDTPSETFGLEQLVQECIETVGNMPDFDRVKLCLDVPSDLTLHAKRVYLKQTIENLLSNAVKYHDPECDEPTVTLAASVDDGVCHLAIDDNGLGIDEDYRNRLFSMFQRFHPDVSFGTGLGLYLVKQNASALNGEIAYYPKAKGSKFEVTFPTLGA